jgi:putative RNA 2'-phosphotransferase
VNNLGGGAGGERALAKRSGREVGPAAKGAAAVPDWGSMSQPAERVRLSKLVSLVLRHRPQDFGVTLDPAGWTDIAQLLAGLAAHGHPVTRDDLLAVVQTSDKQRFAVSADGLRVRANQGHSVQVELQHAAAHPPDRLFHGTVARNLASIRKTGLSRGRRHHVHLSSLRPLAEIVGRRRGVPLILEVLAGRMAAAGHVFLLTPNGVWLTDRVPPEFLLFPD